VKHEETLDGLQRLEAKFIMMCKVAFRIDFEVTNWGSDDEKEYVEVAGSRGTSSNPIILEEDMEVDIKGKAKMHETSNHVSPAKPPLS
jgi:hypothetical protein